MRSSSHVSEENLARLADGEIQGGVANPIRDHLEGCVQCRSRFEQLQRGAAAYRTYHERVLKPSLDGFREWPELPFSATVEEAKNRSGFPAGAWWAAAATCAVLLVGLFFYREMPHRRMTQLLGRAAAMPSRAHRRLHVTSDGQSWYRPAVVHGGVGMAAPQAQDFSIEHTRALFETANYSWDDPLSARSFAAWRSGLHDKRDEVVSLRSEDGRRRFFRLRTDTSEGLLRMASLTLRADTLNPVEGRFHFGDQGDVTMADSGDMPATQPSAISNKAAAPAHAAMVETKVSPEDELRVFAALDAIGADAGEAVTVEVDSSRKQIVVSGVGISDERQQEIRKAVSQIPNTTTHFNSGEPSTSTKAIADTGTADAAGASAPLRHLLESKAGGAEPFQEIADRALDGSSAVLAHAHALYVLAQSFPPTVESTFGVTARNILRSLRHRHAAAIEQTTVQVRDVLGPLFDSPANKTGGSGETEDLRGPWQAGAGQLLNESKTLDQSLSRLLAGSYSAEAGEDMFHRLPGEIQSVETLARAQDTSR